MIAAISSAGVTSNAGLRAAKRARDLVAGALLDRDLRAVARRRVDRRARRGDVERDAVVRRSDGEPVGADLVRGVAVGRDPVGADDDAVDPPAAHQMRGRRVGDHRVRDAERLELPRRQPRALQQRPRLVDPDVRQRPSSQAARSAPSAVP